MPASPIRSVETPQSWRIAVTALVILTMAFGGVWINTVALKDIAAEVGGARSVPAFASAAAWLSAGGGGIGWGMSPTVSARAGPSCSAR